jgi:hypothetical protein
MKTIRILTIIVVLLMSFSIMDAQFYFIDTNTTNFRTLMIGMGNTVESEGYAVSDVDFYINGYDSSLVTSTELIQCSPSSNVYKQIFINRTNGIPREGIVVDCSGNVDTVAYLTSTLRATALDAYRFPKIYDDSLTLVTYKPLIFNIIDLNDGSIVFEENITPQQQRTTHTATIYSPDGQGLRITSMGNNVFGINDDIPNIVYFGSVPAGAYFFNFFDEDGNIMYSKTIIKKDI